LYVLCEISYYARIEVIAKWDGCVRGYISVIEYAK